MYKHVVSLIPHVRRYSPALVAAAMPFVVGCLAAAAEQSSRPSAIQLTWETLVTIYGPMAVWLIWFIRRDDQRRKEDAEHRREWTGLVKNNTEALANVTTSLSLGLANDEKNRLATYKVADELKEVGLKVESICDSLVRNTRLIQKE